MLPKMNVLGGMTVTLLILLMIILFACSSVHAIAVNNTTEQVNMTIDDLNESVFLEKTNTTANSYSEAYNESYTNTSVDLGFKPLDIAGGFNHESGQSNSKNINSETHNFYERNYTLHNDRMAGHYIDKRSAVDIAQINADVVKANNDKEVSIVKANNDKEVSIVKANNDKELALAEFNLKVLKTNLDFRMKIFDKLMEKHDNMNEIYQDAKRFGILMTE